MDCVSIKNIYFKFIYVVLTLSLLRKIEKKYYTMLLYSARLYNYTIVQAEKKKEVTDDIRSFTFLLLVNHFELHQCLTNMCLLSFDNFPSSSIWHLLFAFFLTWSNMANQHPLQFPFSKSYLLFICTTFGEMKNKIMLLVYLVGYTDM